MAFKKKTWVNRLTEYPNRRTLTSENGSAEVVTVSRNEGTVTQEGDAFSAENMNDLENRISSGFTDITSRLVLFDVTVDKNFVGLEVVVSNGEDTQTVLVDATMKFSVAFSSLGTYTFSNPVTGKDKTVKVDFYGRYDVEVMAYHYYSAIIDFGHSEPSEMVTYADDAVGMEKQSDDWFNQFIFKDLKPCVLADGGKVTGYLDKKNYANFEDGSGAGLTTFGQDVMLEIPRTGYLIKYLEDGTLKVSVTDDPNNEEYYYDAFSLDSYNDCDKIYLGVYESSYNANKLYSNSGKNVANNATIGNCRIQATNRGAGYQLLTYAALKLYQCLLILYTGSLNSQKAIGMGYVLGSHTTGVTTGLSDSYGFNSEIIKSTNPTYMTDSNHSVKALGLENMWGNYWEWVDGIITNAKYELLTCELAKNLNDTNTWKNNGAVVGANTTGYLVSPIGTNATGFAPKSFTGSDSTYFCDYDYMYANCIALRGGAWTDASFAGAFCLYLPYASSFANASIGSRLMYLQKEM